MDRRVCFRIRYGRRSGVVTLLLVAALPLVAVLGYLALGQGEAVASSPEAPAAPSASLRQYYLTKDSYDGAHVITACASGYHMASLWEILDPSNLKYSITQGFTRPDSGMGPPSSYQAWVRTGYISSTTSAAGMGNCDAWTSNDINHYGTLAQLLLNWTGGTEDVHVWDVGIAHCNGGLPVWCVADNIGSTIYLPAILRNYASS